jgi:hypothetical protein
MSVDKPNINRIARELIEAKILDGRFLSWFECFTSFANVASYGNFPNEEEWKDMTIRAKGTDYFHHRTTASR